MIDSLIKNAGLDAGKARQALPPVEQWHPPFCGAIDMRISRDGTWFYNGTPIARPALVRLFSTILRKDPDGYVLVTPVEKVGIDVEDAPFLAVEMSVVQPRVLRFATNVGDWVEAGTEHPIRFEKSAHGGIKPYIHVRGGLWALATRTMSLELAGLCETREHAGAACFGVVSAGVFFPIAAEAEVEALAAGGSERSA
ncbi:DUF1285 domain-containing protein [Methylocapsa sp. D3K7]|uniref:DUF1285 domain-containing protein n=1 Tax=Methylocapsa sp. D3K7 TaxID=3041435 RepID=UPI00244E89E7|nr:DUF1285 domain-containing protein [Methylocapsa sp. D3K7]WGJ14678.1 DUF1285 domain-containing protein [Methylocapsa sp. D3K7]